MTGMGSKRALHISSPIGLGHAQRDVAIAGQGAEGSLVVSADAA